MLEDRATAKQHPDHTRHFGGERNNDGVGMSSREKATQPLTEPDFAAAQCRQGRTGSCINILRKYLLPRLVMPSKRGLPPVVACQEQVRARRRDRGPARRFEHHRPQRPEQLRWRVRSCTRSLVSVCIRRRPASCTSRTGSSSWLQDQARQRAQAAGVQAHSSNQSPG